MTPVPNGSVTAYSKKYYYDHAGRLVAETVTKTLQGEGTVTERVVFLRDESSIIGMEHTAGGVSTRYYFQRNLMGDVLAIVNTSGTVVARYLYDAFGNCTIASSTTNAAVANANPIRYRGYYYDDDTGLYYCNARYYSPKWRRFISPDDTAYLDPETVNGLNLYCYCNNDPVNYADPSGHSIIASILIGMAVSSIVGWGLSMVFGAQIAGGIGSVVGGGTAIYTGIGLCAFGPWGIAAGIAIMALGAATVAFGANEIIDGATGINYIQNWTGLSDNAYNGIYIGLNITSSIGSLAGGLYMRSASNNILNSIIKEPSKITNYKLWQIKTYGRYTSLYTPGTLGRGSHAGQGYTLTHNTHASKGYIQWHPGGGHHGPYPYWKITSTFHKAARYYYLTGMPF